ncbi:hypothetical protein DINM_022527 [Dirofilaria immitis]|nr:hypothetical protein [Dirofilaria immitis]
MLPIYCIRILINTFVEFASSVQFNTEPRFTSLTPYQTADSLPPPKLLSPANVQSKNWEIPPGAKLIGYNVQMISSYIPTIYLEKNNKRRLKSGNSAVTTDIYSKHLPGYNMTMKGPTGKKYDVNQRSNEMDTLTAQIDWLENNTDNVLLKDEPTVHTNFRQWKNRFLEKREDSVDSTGTTVGIVDFSSFLWPIIEAEPEPDSRNTKNRLEGEISNDSIPILQSNVAISSAESIPRMASIYDIDGLTPNRFTTDTILMIKPYEHEEGVKAMKGSSDVQVVSPAILQNSTMVTTSDALIMAQTTIMNVDSSEFDDENYEETEQNDMNADNLDFFPSSEENSEEKQKQVNGPIFSPEQIPSFEEWLSSLPIQPFPFPNVKSGAQNHQLSTNHFHVPFLRATIHVVEKCTI